MTDYQRVLEMSSLFSPSRPGETAAYAATHTLHVLESDIEEWKNTLPSNLHLTPDTAELHKAMWNTSANTSTWCWAAAHALWIGSALGLAQGRARAAQNKNGYIAFAAHPAHSTTSIWPQISQKHALLMSTLGEERIIRSGILHALVKPLITFSSVLSATDGDGENAQIREWKSSYLLAGLNGMDLADERTASFLRSEFLPSYL